jgi:hypothetical protein
MQKKKKTMMMRQVFLYRNILVALLILAGFTATGQDYRKRRNETKSFKIQEDVELRVVNKYGRIQLIPWTKDSIKFVVDIEVRAKKEAKAQSTLDNIDIEFISFQSYIESKTSFTGEGSFWGGVKEKTGSVFSGDNKTQIDYKIYLPSNVHINIENKYGDIFMEDHLGRATISLSNGDLRARSFQGPTSLTLEFAYANIKELTNGSVNMSHRSELKLEETEELKIDSRSSRITLGTVQKLEIQSYRDKYFVQNVASMTANSSYTYLEINTLGEYLSVDARYGSVDINVVESKVKRLDFNVEDTDVGIKKPETRSITIEAIYSEEAGLYFPSELVNKNTTMEDEEEKLVKTTGMVGDSFISPIKLTITIPSGNLRINE